MKIIIEGETPVEGVYITLLKIKYSTLKQIKSHKFNPKLRIRVEK